MDHAHLSLQYSKFTGSGIHTVQIRTGRRKWAQMGRVRDCTGENVGIDGIMKGS